MMTSPSPASFREEFIARKNWRFFETALEIFYSRNSRIRWLLEGDANTRFFHKAVLAHQARNAIRFLLTVDDQRIVNKYQIIGMIIAYFQNLLGSVNVGVSPMEIADIQRLYSYRCPAALHSSLLDLPSEDEISRTLLAMPRSKAPGADGFSVEFHKEAWSIVGSHTVAAVLEFFQSRRLHSGVNVTAISLIPKVTGADRLHLFRPISLCSTTYKVISRILKKRLQLFVAEIVQRNQVDLTKAYDNLN